MPPRTTGCSMPSSSVRRVLKAIRASAYTRTPATTSGGSAAGGTRAGARRILPGVLIKACLNGARRRQEHPAIPVTPDELAAESRRAVEARAGALHVHPRAADGSQTLDP